MSISNFNEVAEELLKLSKEIQQLQKQLNDEQQQRLQMEQTIQQLLDKLGKKRINLTTCQTRSDLAADSLISRALTMHRCSFI